MPSRHRVAPLTGIRPPAAATAGRLAEAALPWPQCAASPWRRSACEVARRLGEPPRAGLGRLASDRAMNPVPVPRRMERGHEDQLGSDPRSTMARSEFAFGTRAGARGLAPTASVVVGRRTLPVLRATRARRTSLPGNASSATSELGFSGICRRSGSSSPASRRKRCIGLPEQLRCTPSITRLTRCATAARHLASPSSS